jgi:protein gp37
MAGKTFIQWTDATVNFWRGSTKVSPGCKYCYMYRISNKMGWNPAVVRRCKDETFYQALNWKAPRMIFTNSLSDFFTEEADS